MRNRLCIFFLIIAITLCALPFSVSAAVDTPTADVNADGRVTIADALLLVHALLNSTVDSNHDVNGDGRVTLRDVLYVIRMSVATDVFPTLSGSGTKQDPYRITSETDLALLSNTVLQYADTEGLYFVQTADIRLTAANWTPIGTGGIPFAGQYDGSGYKVEGLSIRTDESFQGLFGFITGTVENLDVYGTVSVHYNGTHSHSFAGGIVGAMNNGAVVKNCNSYVTIEGDSYVGGVVGAVVYTDDYVTDAFSVIENCNFYGALQADDRSAINEDAMYFGGIAGRAYGAVKNCINYGNVTVSGEKTRYIGGITGYAYSPYKTYSPSAEQLPLLAMENCENKGTVSGNQNVAGIAGQTSLPIKNCVNNGAISGAQYVGGIAGINGTSATYTEGYSVISDCANNGKITVTTSNGGGIAGYNYVKILSCNNAGEVLGAATATRIGGIAGYSRGNVFSCNNLAAAKITGHQGIGGIVGYFNQSGTAVQDCKNYADVAVHTAAQDAYHIGGIVGMLGSTNSVLRCENEGNILGGGGTHTAGTGGIVGSLHSGSIIEDCINRSNVTANMRVGGIAGHGKMSKASYIRGCDNYGTVCASAASGDVHLGGILGSATSGNITNCTNHGSIQTEQAVTAASKTVGSKNDATEISNVK